MNLLCGGFGFIQQLGQAKIQNLYLSGVSDHYVAGFDIAVDDAAGVGSCQRISYLDCNQKGAAQFQWASTYQLAHIASFDVLHGDEVHTIGFVEIEDSADVRMIEGGGEACFAFEALEIGFFDS